MKENNKFKTISFDSNGNTNYSEEITIGNFLNNNYLNPSNGFLTNEQVNMIADNTTWYLGTVGSGGSYILAKYIDTNQSEYAIDIDSKVGLLRLGELMSGQFNRYTSNIDMTNTDLIIPYWLITPYSTTNIRTVSGSGSNSIPSNTNGIKPAFNLKSNVIITSGDGTKNNPFNIALE